MSKNMDSSDIESDISLSLECVTDSEESYDSDVIEDHDPNNSNDEVLTARPYMFEPTANPTAEDEDQGNDEIHEACRGQNRLGTRSW